MKKYLIAVILLVMFCGIASAAKYEISDEQRNYILSVMARAQIQGSEAQMLLQCAQVLQRPIAEVPKEQISIVEAPKPVKIAE